MIRCYVLGFVTDGREVALLLRKPSRPEMAWQSDLFNGIGGGREPGESPEHAMARECKEELGVSIPRPYWRQFATLEGTHPDGVEWIVHCFVANVTHPRGGYTGRREPAFLARKDRLESYGVIPNLHWLIPMAHVHQLSACKEISHYRIIECPVGAAQENAR